MLHLSKYFFSDFFSNDQLVPLVLTYTYNWPMSKALHGHMESRASQSVADRRGSRNDFSVPWLEFPGAEECKDDCLRHKNARRPVEHWNHFWSPDIFFLEKMVDF